MAVLTHAGHRAVEEHPADCSSPAAGRRPGQGMLLAGG